MAELLRLDRYEAAVKSKQPYIKAQALAGSVRYVTRRSDDKKVATHMGLLTERQQKAQELSREMAKMQGVWITSPLPLDDGAKLRFQVLDTCKNEVLQLLSDWEWKPAFCSFLPRVTFTGMQPACLYEIDLPRERQLIHDDRTIRNDIADAEREKAAAEVAAMRKHLGMKR
jgi:hypothetical protein